jgi:hypothetical protein
VGLGVALGVGVRVGVRVFVGDGAAVRVGKLAESIDERPAGSSVSLASGVDGA